MKREIRVIKCKSIELINKNIITIEKAEDFLFLTGDFVFRCKGFDYIIGDTTIYVHEVKK